MMRLKTLMKWRMLILQQHENQNQQFVMRVHHNTIPFTKRYFIIKINYFSNGVRAATVSALKSGNEIQERNQIKEINKW